MIYLDAKTEFDLIIKAQAGCLESQNRLIQSNTKLIWQIANRFRPTCNLECSHDIDDFFQEAIIICIRVIKKYNRTKLNKNGQPYRLMTYVGQCIFSGLVDTINQTGRLIREKKYKKSVGYKNSVRCFSDDNKWINQKWCDSLDYLAVDNADDHEFVCGCLDVLTQTDKYVLVSAIAGEKSFNEIGREIGMSANRVKQRFRSALLFTDKILGITRDSYKIKAICGHKQARHVKVKV